MNTWYRAQILLEPEQHQALTEIAQDEGRSISDLVREIVRQHLTQRDQTACRQGEMQAIQELTHIRKQLQERRGIFQLDLLAEMRAEREQNM